MGKFLVVFALASVVMVATAVGGDNGKSTGKDNKDGSGKRQAGKSRYRDAAENDPSRTASRENDKTRTSDIEEWKMPKKRRATMML